MLGAKSESEAEIKRERGELLVFLGLGTLETCRVTDCDSGGSEGGPGKTWKPETLRLYVVLKLETQNIVTPQAAEENKGWGGGILNACVCVCNC